MIATLLLTVAALTPTASAFVDEACEDLAAEGAPEGYSEQGQQDHLLNYFALATTLSPLHSVVPHAAGEGSIGLDLIIIPPLPCKRRLVLDYSKTEDTNKAPFAPRPRAMFTFPMVGPVAVYAGAAYVPPIPLFGTRNVIASGELGFGLPSAGGFEWGGRLHATMMKTIGEIATPFDPADPEELDFYQASTFGLDLMLGWNTPALSPYLAVGFTDVSTFFYIGDDGVVSNNRSPYAGLTTSLGVQSRIGEHFQWGAELYAAPYNFNGLREEDITDGGDPGFARSQLYTGRLRASYVFGQSADS